MLGTPVGMPLASGHLRIGRRRRAGQRHGQHALDVVGIGTDGLYGRGPPEHHGQQQRQRATAPDTRAVVLPAQALHHPGRQQPQSEWCDEAAARRQLPPVEPHLVQGPAQGTEHHQGIYPQRRAAACQQQHASEQEAGTENGEIPGTAQADELDATYRQRQAEDDAQHAADDDRHGISFLLLSGRASLRRIADRRQDGRVWKLTGGGQVLLPKRCECVTLSRPRARPAATAHRRNR